MPSLIRRSNLTSDSFILIPLRKWCLMNRQIAGYVDRHILLGFFP